MTAKEYAQAIYEMGDRADIKKIRAALERRRHERMMPRIFAEYQKLLLANKKLATHKKITPHKERTRTLLELYQKLVTSA